MIVSGIFVSFKSSNVDFCPFSKGRLETVAPWEIVPGVGSAKPIAAVLEASKLCVFFLLCRTKRHVQGLFLGSASGFCVSDLKQDKLCLYRDTYTRST